MQRLALTALVLLAAAACASVDVARLPRITLDFGFAQKHKCQGVSPEIRLTNVPSGVVTYDIKMTDLDAPSFHHWAQTVPASAPVIREGAGTGYYGPCPPSGTHRYQIEIIGRDAQKNPLAYGEKTVVTGR
jgi:phosphatidylethanolamine-binding protein (PEBP) family uncharacterized protein